MTRDKIQVFFSGKLSLKEQAFGQAFADPSYFWGRANGWVMVATVELLDLLPEDHSDRDALIKILQDQAKGTATVQSGSGLWHQMLDRPDSYLETSCTAMFVYSMAKGVNRGWLNPQQYGPTAIAGWCGVQQDQQGGKLSDVCIGTSYADDNIYYYPAPRRMTCTATAGAAGGVGDDPADEE
jgi:rhamnogalacturonyl hydrolase YesR